MAIPLVYGGNVEPSGDETRDRRFDYVSLESAEGLAWLETISSFRYESSGESFKPLTVRKETTRTGEYWYAYRKVSGKLYKKYVGKSSEMTLDKLEEIAEALNNPPDPLVTDKVTGVTERVKRVTEKVTHGVTIEEFNALKSQVQMLQQSVEALRSELPGKSDAGNSEELPTVRDSELQIRLGNLELENAELHRQIENSDHLTRKLKEEVQELRSALATAERDASEWQEENSDLLTKQREQREEIERLTLDLADLKQKSATTGKDLPDTFTFLNKLKAEFPRTRFAISDAEKILGIIEKS